MTADSALGSALSSLSSTFGGAASGSGLASYLVCSLLLYLTLQLNATAFRFSYSQAGMSCFCPFNVKTPLLEHMHDWFPFIGTPS